MPNSHDTLKQVPYNIYIILSFTIFPAWSNIPFELLLFFRLFSLQPYSRHQYTTVPTTKSNGFRVIVKYL